MGTAEIMVIVTGCIKLLMTVMDLVDADPNRTLDPADRKRLQESTRELVARAAALV